MLRPPQYERLLLLGLQRVDELLPSRACHDPHRAASALLAAPAGGFRQHRSHKLVEAHAFALRQFGQAAM